MGAVVVTPGVRQAVPTGLSIELPVGYEGQVRPRSGLALKHSITVANTPGTIDPGYRGEIRVILINLGASEYKIEKGDRIAQLVIAKYEPVEWEEGELNESTRGAGGFGSSGREADAYATLLQEATLCTMRPVRSASREGKH